MLALAATSVGRTPLVGLRVLDREQGTTTRIGIKLEFTNPTGSVKDRTAIGLLEAMHRQSPLCPGNTVVESTSGNLGVAMASFLSSLGCRFVAVIDPHTPPDVRRELVRRGAEVHDVVTPDANGGYLLSRLRVVEELSDAHPGYRWSNQYGNPANCEIHFRTTGPELMEQAPDMDAIYVAVSTGGTLAGVSRYLRALRPIIRIVAVDADGSIALGGTPALRLLSGIGASRPSSFLTEQDFDAVSRIADVPSFAMCRALRAQTGVALGGSSGSVLTACLNDCLSGDVPVHRSVCIAADGGANYASSFFDDKWLSARGVLGSVRHAEAVVNARFAFEFDPHETWTDRPGYRTPGVVNV